MIFKKIEALKRLLVIIMVQTYLYSLDECQGNCRRDLKIMLDIKFLHTIYIYLSAIARGCEFSR